MPRKPNPGHTANVWPQLRQWLGVAAFVGVVWLLVFPNCTTTLVQQQGTGESVQLQSPAPVERRPATEGGLPPPSGQGPLRKTPDAVVSAIDTAQHPHKHDTDTKEPIETVATPDEPAPVPAEDPGASFTYSAEVVHGKWLVDAGKTYEEAAAEIGADKEPSSAGVAPGSSDQNSLRLVARITKYPGDPFRIALPTRSEDTFRADIAANGDYYDTGLGQFIIWSMYDFLPALTQDLADYRSLGAGAFAAAEPAQFLDVGCNAGWATMLAASLGARATCVEPNPRLNTRMRMSRALAHSDQLPGTLLLVPGGADSVNGVSRMEFPVTENFGTASLVPKDRASTPASSSGCRAANAPKGAPGNKWCFDVNAYRLDDVLLDSSSPLGAPAGQIRQHLKAVQLQPEEASAKAEENKKQFLAAIDAKQTASPSTSHLAKGPPVAMKLDIEGMEPEALKGMRTMLKGGMVKVLRCEYVPGHLARSKATGASFIRMLYDLGFRIFFHEAKTTQFYSSYSCSPGWKVPTVPENNIDRFTQTAYPGRPQDVNSDVILVHESVAADLTPSIVAKLYGSSPLKSIAC